MIKRHYDKGDRIDALSEAGEPFDQYEQDGIRADVFTLPGAYQIPMIQSDDPGSGKLGPFLTALRQELHDRPIRFVNVINGRLRSRLLNFGFVVLDDDEES